MMIFLIIYCKHRVDKNHKSTQINFFMHYIFEGTRMPTIVMQELSREEMGDLHGKVWHLGKDESGANQGGQNGDLALVLKCMKFVASFVLWNLLLSEI